MQTQKILTRFTHYEILGITSSASQEQIRAAWIEANKIWHPNKFKYWGPSDSPAMKSMNERISKRINHARDTLRDDKNTYDNEIQSPPKMEELIEDAEIKEGWNQLKKIYSDHLVKLSDPIVYAKDLTAKFEDICKMLALTSLSSHPNNQETLIDFRNDLKHFSRMIEHEEFKDNQLIEIERLKKENTELKQKLAAKHQPEPEKKPSETSRKAAPSTSTAASGMWSNTNSASQSSSRRPVIKKMTVDEGVSAIYLEFNSAQEIEAFKKKFGDSYSEIGQMLTLLDDRYDVELYPNTGSDDKVFIDIMRGILNEMYTILQVENRNTQNYKNS